MAGMLCKHRGTDSRASPRNATQGERERTLAQERRAASDRDIPGYESARETAQHRIADSILRHLTINVCVDYQPLC